MAFVELQSNKDGELNVFLDNFYEKHIELKKQNQWKKNYENPIEMVDIISIYIDNLTKFNIKMWISLDKNVFINITDQNANIIIKYLFERYPY